MDEWGLAGEDICSWTCSWASLVVRPANNENAGELQAQGWSSRAETDAVASSITLSMDKQYKTFIIQTKRLIIVKT